MAGIPHLYIHIPFCPNICPYCCFHVLKVNRRSMDGFLNQLGLDLNTWSSKLDCQSVYFGGGTPTALSLKQLEQLFESAHISRFEAEVTMECNPSTLSIEKARLLKQAGVNRLSIGAQSLDESVLKTLGRTHSTGAVHECVENAREGGFENLGLDLIFGVPGQSLESWKATLEEALSMDPSHVSCYGLTYEEDTPFFEMRLQGKLSPHPESEIEMFRMAREILGGSGYEHYEISNYAKHGRESRHNLAYWDGRDYLGLGPSAVSTLNGKRRQNGNLSHDSTWDAGSEETLSEQVLASERMALGLRTNRGIDVRKFQERFGFSPLEKWKKDVLMLQEQGLMVMEGGRLSLTGRGFEVADEIAVQFMS
jgi:oxygen-independent coproporphyrinogen III oxidase